MKLKEKLIKSLDKISSEPVLIFTLPIALFLFPIIIFLRPFVLLRFGFFHSDRLGHFAVNTEIFFSEEKKFLKLKTPTFDFCYFPTIPCNRQLAKMISRKIKIFPKFFIRPFCLISRSINFLSVHVTARSSNNDYDTNHVLDKIKLQLSLTQEEIEKGKKILKKIKVNTNDIVCVGVRDESYLKKTYGHQDFSYHDHRNDDIKKYIPGIKYLLKKGYTVLRMGSLTNKEVLIKHKNFFDYSRSKIKSDFMDVYVSYKCRLFVSNNTGLDALAVIFRKPILHVGSLPVGKISTHYKKLYNTLSNYYSYDLKRFLKLTEIFNSKIQYLGRKQDFDEKKIKIVHPSKHEILKYIKETENILKNKKRKKSHLLLEKKFKKIFNKNVKKYPDGKVQFPQTFQYHNKIKANFLYSFLNLNKHFLK